jgi:hypothetical protein
MNCFYHPATTIVATCQDCKKGLCVECASKFQIPICSQCNENRKEIEIKSIRKDIRHVVLISAILLFLENMFVFRHIYEASHSSSSDYRLFLLYALLIVVNVYYLMGLVVGWKTLNKMTPRVFLFLPLIGWAIYFLVKVYISMFVGLIWTPFWFAKKIKRLNELKIANQ